MRVRAVSGLVTVALIFVGACGDTDEPATSSATGGGLITGAGGGVMSGSGGAAVGSGSGTSSAGGATTTSAGGTAPSAGGGGAAASAGAGGATTCVDIGQGEPNDAETNAFALPGKSDCDDASEVSGVIAGAEEDWFLYAGNDALCVVNPARQFAHMGGLVLCKYFECTNGQNATQIGCPNGTTADVSNGGRPGCCSASGFKVTDVNCTGTIDDDTTVYLRVYAPNANSASCIDYSMHYNY